MKQYQGVPISKGIAISTAFVFHEEDRVIEMSHTTAHEEEIRLFNEAREASILQLKKIAEKIRIEISDHEAAIFEAHIVMLEDFELINQVEEEIKQSNVTAQWAVYVVGQRLEALFASMDSDYFKERAADMIDITDRIINNLQGKAEEGHKITKPCILVASDLSPSKTSSIDTSLVKGIITQKGGKTSHSAIIARLLQIPFVVLEESMTLLEEDQSLIIDGASGEIIVEPNQASIDKFNEKKALLEAQQVKYQSLKGQPCVTKDGSTIQLKANIGNEKDLEYVLSSDASGIGLFRTEFIFMERDSLPDEEEQFGIYRRVVEAMGSKPVTFRTMDIGGDKENPLFNIPKEDNPFLGYRGIRLCLKEPELFRTQLRAILRAGYYGNARIMFPMIASISELRDAKEQVKIAMDELEALGCAYSQEIKMGIMIETPSAAVMADLFAEEADFFSIGTNDLIQYTLAADRMNKQVAELYSQYDPAVLRSIQNVCLAAQEADIEVSVCGESAADPLLTPFFISVGISTLSMTAVSIDEIRWQVLQYEAKKLEDAAHKWRFLKTKDEVVSYLKEL